MNGIYRLLLLVALSLIWWEFDSRLGRETVSVSNLLDRKESRGDASLDSIEDLFEILTNRRRRSVLRYLLNEGGHVELCELVRHVAAVENDVSPAAVNVRQRNRVRTALYQHHLGKMDDVGVIDYDKRSGVVSRTDRTERIEPLLVRPGSDRTELTGFAFGLVTLGIGLELVLVPDAATVSGIVLGGIGSTLVLYTYWRGWSDLVGIQGF